MSNPTIYTHFDGNPYEVKITKSVTGKVGIEVTVKSAYSDEAGKNAQKLYEQLCEALHLSPLNEEGKGK